jgi:hypothetical protein
MKSFGGNDAIALGDGAISVNYYFLKILMK